MKMIKLNSNTFINTMKFIHLIVALLCVQNVIAQNTGSSVKLKVTGYGATRNEAISNGLRSAIEQSFGAFISTNTAILDDQVIADEIVSVSSGNIDSYTIESETCDNDRQCMVIMNASVSIDKLKNYAQAKGVAIEIEGGLFAQNIKQQQLNEESEVIAMYNGLGVIYELLQKSFDYQVTNDVPRSADSGNQNWILPLKVEAKTNQNLAVCKKTLYRLLESLSMSEIEAEEYRRIGKKVFTLDCSASIEQLTNERPDYYNGQEEQKAGRHYLLSNSIEGVYPNTVNARHILIKDKKRGRVILDSLKTIIQANANFKEMAMKYSEDPGSGKIGGDLGWFGRGSMVKPFEDACFNGNVGSLQIVETDFGIHLVELLDRNVERSSYSFRKNETYKALVGLLATWKLYAMCFNIDFGNVYVNGTSSLSSLIASIKDVNTYLPGDVTNTIEFNVPFSLADLEKVGKIQILPNSNFEGVLQVSMIYKEEPIYEKWLSKSLVIKLAEVPYPVMEWENHISGTVLVQCVVEKDGSISNTRVKKGVQGGPNLSRAAENAVRYGKVDGPGQIGKYRVRTVVEVPVVFSLK
jgi:TonB family protein